MFSFHDAARVLGVETEIPNLSFLIQGASIDTRTLQPGELFAALPGSKVDGHQFLEQAFLKGASGAIVSKAEYEVRKEYFFNKRQLFQNLLPVENPLQALTALAAWWRERNQPKVIGITGSVGKTSTKEFLTYLLKENHPVLATQGNFNNHIGLPLTLLRLHPADRFCVAELGANHPGEIKYLCDILKPDAAIITCVSPAHLEGFGSLQAIYDAKLELFESLKPGSIAILPDDDVVLRERVENSDLRPVFVGITRQADYRITDVRVGEASVSFTLNDKKHFRFPSLAGFLVRNAAMAVAMAELLGIEEALIPGYWKSLKLPEGRFQEVKIHQGIRVIYDGYNASPESFARAIEQFLNLKAAGRKILVFADMLELGDLSVFYHQMLGKTIAASGLSVAMAYGEMARETIGVIRENNPRMSAEYFEDPEKLSKFLTAQIQEGDAVLLKASRGMKIEKVLEGLRDSSAVPT